MHIKERIIQVCENQGLTKESFFSDLGYTSANFRSNVMDKQVGSDILIKIVRKYNVSPRWLLIGEGSMYEGQVAEEEQSYYRKSEKDERIWEMMEVNLSDKERIIQMLEKNLSDKETKIKLLEAEIRRLQKPNKKKNAG